MKISLITCVYNTGKYLDRCLCSIQKQSFKDFEVIIIDDGSTDNSKEIISKYLEDARFIYYYQENQGQAVARNKGIELSKGEYIVFIDSDDEIKENYLLNLSSVINEKLDLGFAMMERIFEKKASILEKNFKYIHVYEGKGTNVYDDPSIITKVSNSPCAKIFKRQFLIDNNIIFLPGKLYEDLLFVESVLLSNPKMKFINSNDYLYHIHEGTSMTGNGERVFEMFDVFDSVLEYAKQKNILSVFHDELEYLALYHIAIGTMFRYFAYKPFSFFYSLKKCRKYLRQHNYSHKNKYVKDTSLFTRVYLRIFF